MFTILVSGGLFFFLVFFLIVLIMQEKRLLAGFECNVLARLVFSAPL